MNGGTRKTPHDGVDFGPASVGDPVIASAEGMVVDVTSNPDWGTEVIISHRSFPADRLTGGRPYATGYMHLRRARVAPGEWVTRGQVIGEVGLFPNSSGVVHVHWRLWGLGTIDPLSKTVGCFKPGEQYPSTLQLTYPLRC